MTPRPRDATSVMRWRPTRTSQLGSAVLMAASMGWIAYDNTFVQGHGAHEGLSLLVATALGWWLLAARPAITLTPTAVVVRNPLRVKTIPLQEIADVGADSGGIRIKPRSGRAIHAWAVQKWNVSNLFGRSVRADDVVAAINDRRTRVCDGSS